MTRVGAVWDTSGVPMIRVDATRPWGDDDDASEYVSLPAEWPHDETNCLACGTYDLARDIEGLQRKYPLSKYPDRYVPGLTTRELAVAYPNKFKATLEHRRRVARSRRAAKGQTLPGER